MPTPIIKAEKHLETTTVTVHYDVHFADTRTEYIDLIYDGKKLTGVRINGKELSAEEVVALMTIMNMISDDFERLKKWVIDVYREYVKAREKIRGEY